MATKKPLQKAAEEVLRRDNARLRKKVQELEARNRGLLQSLAAREGDLAVVTKATEVARADLSQLYATVGVMADAVNGSTTAGRIAKDFARIVLRKQKLPLPASLATKKAPAKKRAKKRG